MKFFVFLLPYTQTLILPYSKPFGEAIHAVDESFGFLQDALRLILIDGEMVPVIRHFLQFICLIQHITSPRGHPACIDEGILEHRTNALLRRERAVLVQ